jgi:peroxiredoxin
MIQTPPPADANLVGHRAPDFALPSIQGPLIRLADYRGSQRVVLWFSRGFTCNFCRGYMEGIIRPYPLLAAERILVIQVAPNLFETACRWFKPPPPYPFVCDPDKRLYAVYGLGDRGVLAAFSNTVATFGHAFRHGAGLETVRASWMDLANRDFLRRLHHHALTALDQAIFLIDLDGVVRLARTYQALAQIPTGEALRALVRAHCT